MPEQRRANDIVLLFEECVAQMKTIPVNSDGKPNISALARSCGFDRKRFETNPELGLALRNAIKKKGLGSFKEASAEDIKIREAKTEIKNLRERIEIMQAEIRAGKDRIEKLEKALRKCSEEDIFSQTATIFLDTGRMPR